MRRENNNVADRKFETLAYRERISPLDHYNKVIYMKNDDTDLGDIDLAVGCIVAEVLFRDETTETVEFTIKVNEANEHELFLSSYDATGRYPQKIRIDEASIQRLKFNFLYSYNEVKPKNKH